MPISPVIEWIAIDQLNLDTRNPRLGRHFVEGNPSHEGNPSQEDTLKEIQDWTLDELAVSFLESGFWTQEPPVIVEEDGKLIVVEGNRRIATLKLLEMANRGMPASKKWRKP